MLKLDLNTVMPPKLKHRFFSEIAGALTAITVLGFIFLAASHVTFQDSILAILASLRLHILLPLIFLTLTLAALKCWARTAFFALCIIASITTTFVDLKSSHISAPAQFQAELNVISFNLLGYNTENGARIAAYLKQSAPDVAFIQEAQPLKPFFTDLKTLYPYRIGCGQLIKSCDLLLLSKHPLSQSKVHRLSRFSGSRLFTARTTINGMPVTLVAPHLSKPFQQQHREFEVLAKQINAEKTPLIVAGDFNSAAWAPDFVRFLKTTGLHRFWLEPGTWPSALKTYGVPIDHILTGGNAAISSLAPLPDNFGSNHWGLQAKIVLY